MDSTGQSLIAILLNPTASEAERDDAAMDLAAYDGTDVEEALLVIGSNSSTPSTLAASVGESLAEIWLRNNRFDADAFAQLKGEARMEAEKRIRARRRT